MRRTDGTWLAAADPVAGLIAEAHLRQARRLLARSAGQLAQDPAAHGRV